MNEKPEGAVTVEWLRNEAVRTNKKIRYYVLSKRAHEVLIRYVTPKGNITDGKRKSYPGGFNKNPNTYRFLNYWHIYAYKLLLEQGKQHENSNS